MNEKLLDNIKLWMPLILFLTIIGIAGTTRMVRKYKVSKRARAHFLPTCLKKHRPRRCRELLSSQHDGCLELTSRYASTGFRSSRLIVDLPQYSSCIYAGAPAFKRRLRERRRRKKR